MGSQGTEKEARTGVCLAAGGVGGEGELIQSEMLARVPADGKMNDCQACSLFRPGRDSCHEIHLLTLSDSDQLAFTTSHLHPAVTEADREGGLEETKKDKVTDFY